jgi:LacI family transcriptional regulator
MTNIKDVAKLSQTSVGTVSRYLNGYAVKPVTKEKIEEAIQNLNFCLHPVGRNAKNTKTYTVGVLIPRIANLFSTTVIEGMDVVFEAAGYTTLVCDSKNDAKREKKTLNLLVNRMVDGIVLMPINNSDEHILQFEKTNMPMVLMDRLVANLQCDGVLSDNINGAYQAIEAIINRGHRRIAIIAGPQNIYPANERLKGYLRALKDYNIEVNPELICYAELTRDGGCYGVDRLCSLKEPPTVIFTSNDEITIGAYQALRQRGMVIGQDISLFGYDQTELCQLVEPQISVVIQPLEDIGKTTAEILLSRIKGDYTVYPIIKRLKTEIVLTNSVKIIR